jgi:chromosomal replication initiation ATPase DnaA
MIDSRTIINEVATVYGITKADLIGPCRKPATMDARRIAMMRIRNETRLSLPAIGRIFKREHTTVLYNIRVAEQSLKGVPHEVAV